MAKQAAINYQQRAVEFQVGDSIVPFGVPAEKAGRVVAVYPAIGMVDVEFPFGSKRYPVEDIQKLKESVSVETPHTDSTPGGAGSYEVSGGPVALTKRAQNLASLWLAKEASEDVETEPKEDILSTDEQISSTTVPKSATEMSPEELEKLAKHLESIEIPDLPKEEAKQPQQKQAIYWNGTDRKYRATQTEVDSKQYLCPRCKDVILQRAVYKREGGQSERLFGCRHCLFLVLRDDLTNCHLNPLTETVV